MHPYFKTLILLLICTAFVPLAKASDSTLLNYKLNASGNFSKTNDGFTLLFNNNARTSIKHNKYELNTSGSWIFGRNPQKLTNDDWRATLDFNYYTQVPALYTWGLFNFTSSYSLKVIGQYQSGLGLAYTLFKDKPFELNISNGILYEWSHITTNEENNVMYQTWRNSFRLRAKYNYKDLQVNNLFFHQASLNDRDDIIWSNQFNIEYKITHWLNIKSSLVYNKVSRTNKENLIFTYGISSDGQWWYKKKAKKALE